MSDLLFVARTPAGAEIALPSVVANRHGLITGATGTGKTVTLQVLAEGFSRLGVPTFMADIKGDLAGLAAAGTSTPKMTQRLQDIGVKEPAWRSCPVVFWDLFGASGHPVRATVSDMGPLLLGRLLNLNDTQQGVLTIVFKAADDAGLLLLDLKDLRAMLQFVSANAKQLNDEYGRVSTASVGSIQRGLLTLEEQGADQFFGEPMLNIDDLLQTGPDGRGVVNILSADRLMTSPKLYSTFLLWLLAELYENLPEVGDVDKPKMAFFFEEAHLLFSDAPPALLQKIEQVVRLIRSKGVGVYFITQNPNDVPESVLAQLGNRVQHALRAFTPREQKAVRAAAETLRSNPSFDTRAAISELGVGEALVSFLDERGTPVIVERAWVLPPASRIGSITPEERRAVINGSVIRGHYEQMVDRESAYEKLKGRAERSADAAAAEPGPASPPAAEAPRQRSAPAPAPPRSSPSGGSITDILLGSTGPRGGRREGIIESAARSAARSVGSGMAREIMRGVLGSLLGRRR